MQAHGPDWKVPLGRRDSLTANLTLANERLPNPAFNLTQLKDAFTIQGLDTTDLVALSGIKMFPKLEKLLLIKVKLLYTILQMSFELRSLRVIYFMIYVYVCI